MRCFNLPRMRRCLGASATLFLLPAVTYASPVATRRPMAKAVPGAGKEQPDKINTRVTAARIYAEQADPELPGRLLWKLWARDVDMASPATTVYATVRSAHAVLFNKGIAEATILAPMASADSDKYTIVGTGRVTVTSLLQPGTWLKADEVTWYAKLNRGLAVGNVVMHNSRTGLTVHSPQLGFDTALKTLQSSAGYGTLP